MPDGRKAIFPQDVLAAGSFCADFLSKHPLTRPALVPGLKRNAAHLRDMLSNFRSRIDWTDPDKARITLAEVGDAGRAALIEGRDAILLCSHAHVIQSVMAVLEPIAKRNKGAAHILGLLVAFAFRVSDTEVIHIVYSH
jgi:hypothetical protein